MNAERIYSVRRLHIGATHRRILRDDGKEIGSIQWDDSLPVLGWIGNGALTALEMLGADIFDKATP